jgi:hypothetical protein
MEDKPVKEKKWWESKSIWTAIVAAILGLIEPISALDGESHRRAVLGIQSSSRIRIVFSEGF